MPHYVQIRNKKTGRKMGINADIWAIEKERNKANKDYEFEEVQPVTVTIPRRSANGNIGEPEKKSQVVADSLTPVVDKAIAENPEPEHLKQGSLADLVPKEIKAEVTEVAKAEVSKVPVAEPKKRGRPKRIV